jgi:sulfite exporter TauE/SafE
MPETGYLAVFLVGLLGGTHCIGMCGGIVSALTLQVPGSPTRWPLHLAYNLGRIATYAAAGGLMGAVGGVALALDSGLPVQFVLYVLANLMLVALGLYLTGSTWALAFTERLGQVLWRRVQPITGRFLPARTVPQALTLGALWGFLPCGMVYSVLATALVAGSAARGAALMLAFGLGTLPNLLLAGALLARLRGFVGQRPVRLVSGLVVLGFGVVGLMNAAGLAGRIWPELG